MSCRLKNLFRIFTIPFFLMANMVSAQSADIRNWSGVSQFDGKIQVVYPGIYRGLPQKVEALGGSWIVSALPGPNQMVRSFKSFEDHPKGWWQFQGASGYYSVFGFNHKEPVRPAVWTGIPIRRAERMRDLRLEMKWDYAMTNESSWDETSAKSYFQIFQAQGTSVTHVGFKLAHDGIDGVGPEGQDIRVEIYDLNHSMNQPLTWTQIGPSQIARNVDLGGVKFQPYQAGWNSGEIPLKPGEYYAVRLTAQQEAHGMQSFLSEQLDPADDSGCWRLGLDEKEWQKINQNIWLTVDGDGDGLLIPYNIKSSKVFGDFAGFAPEWSQSFIARGKSLAGVALYAAVGGSQPPIDRQKVAVSIHKKFPNGPQTGFTKIASGIGNYTGDASWGAFGAVFAPQEIPLDEGGRYWVSWRTLENEFTLGNFVNIKGLESDGNIGFNPYLRPDDDNDLHLKSAVKNRNHPIAGTLNALIVTYEKDLFEESTSNVEPVRWRVSLKECEDPATLLRGPRLSARNLIQPFEESEPYVAPWRSFSLVNQVQFSKEKRFIQGNRPCWALTVHDGGRFGKVGGAIDGGWVYTASGLDPHQSYIFTGWIRSSYGPGLNSQVNVGWDESGQGENPDAVTIKWGTRYAMEGLWIPFQSPPLRPIEDRISLWARASSDAGIQFRFSAEFADLRLREIEYRLDE